MEGRNSKAWQRLADARETISSVWRSKAESYENALKTFEADGWGPYVRAIHKLMKGKK